MHNMDCQSKSFISPGFCLDEKTLASLLSQAIANICQQHTFYEKQLRIMGVLCLDVDSAESDIVVKINDTFNKNCASNADDMLSSKDVRMLDEPRRKRKRMRPQRTLIRFPGEIVECDTKLNQCNSESLSCPVTLSDENDESITSQKNGERENYFPSMNSTQEEGEIVLSSVDVVPRHNDDENNEAKESTNDEMKNSAASFIMETHAISNSGDEVEISNEYQDLTKTSSTNCTSPASTEAFARSNAYFIPQLSSFLTQFLNANKQGLAANQVQLVTCDGQFGVQAKTTTTTTPPVIQSGKTNERNQCGDIANVKHDAIKARVAEVFAAVQNATQLEQEAKKMASKANPLTSINRNSRRRKRHRSLSLDVSNATATAQLSPSSQCQEYSMKASTALPTSLNDALSLNCFAVNRVFKCTFCGKTFNRKFCLERHERLHTGVKPYECVYCGERYIRLEDKKRHIRTFHPSKAEILEAGEISPPYNTVTSSPSPADSEEPLLPASPPCFAPCVPLLAGAIAFP